MEVEVFSNRCICGEDMKPIFVCDCFSRWACDHCGHTESDEQAIARAGHEIRGEDPHDT